MAIPRQSLVSPRSPVSDSSPLLDTVAARRLQPAGEALRPDVPVRPRNGVHVITGNLMALEAASHETRPPLAMLNRALL
jgi:hypothetical protein